MATPYCNYDPGYSREERRMLEHYLGECPDPAEDDRTSYDDGTDAVIAMETAEMGEYVSVFADDAVAFLTAPTMAGCKALMAPSADIARAIIRHAEAR